ncbi:unnamed protein product [Cuscuta epithymum]|uniref:Uncharacterized protein n=1 Tax=Cuscuta epithymum TaxID=186058 RepID=A0AAV0FBK5_9ASTE|nr:unnamed protein product [Cuscuta epithymum]
MMSLITTLYCYSTPPRTNKVENVGGIGPTKASLPLYLLRLAHSILLSLGYLYCGIYPDQIYTYFKWLTYPLGWPLCVLSAASIFVLAYTCDTPLSKLHVSVFCQTSPVTHFGSLFVSSASSLVEQPAQKAFQREQCSLLLPFLCVRV